MGKPIQMLECIMCNSGDVYTKTDGTRICRRCGATWNPIKKKRKVRRHVL